jgi:predicted RNase H-like nuclease
MTTKLNREIAVRKSLGRSKTDPSKINNLAWGRLRFAMGFATDRSRVLGDFATGYLVANNFERGDVVDGIAGGAGNCARFHVAERDY